MKKIMKNLVCYMIALTFTLILASNLKAAALSVGSLSSSQGATNVSIPINLSAATGEEACGFNLDLNFDISRLTFKAVNLGPQAVEAGKSLSHSQPNSNTVRVIVIEFNQNIIGDGVVLNFTFDVLNNAPPGNAELTITKPAVSDLYANLLPVAIENGSIMVEPDIISYWKFDEGQGVIAYDAVGDNDGTLAGSDLPDWVYEEDDWALQFAYNVGCGWSTSGRVTVGDDPSLHFEGDDSFTLEVWIKLDQPYYGGPRIIRKLGDFPPDYSNHSYYTLDLLGEGDQRISFALSDEGGVGYSVQSEATINDDGVWHHIVAVKDAAQQQIRLYLDYVNVTTAFCDVGLIRGGDDPLVIGYQFTGRMDDVAIYRRALSDEEIQSRYTQGLKSICPDVSYWKLDEGSGTAAYDSVGDNDGLMGGGSPPVWISVEGDTALNFQGVCGCGSFGGYLQVADNASLHFSGSFSIEAWVKFPGPWCALPEIWNKQSNNSYYNIRIYNLGDSSDGKVQFYMRDNQGRTCEEANCCSVSSAVAINDDQWHHLVAVRDSGAQELRLYIDYVNQTTDKGCDAGYVSGEPNSLYIGGNPLYGSTYFNGIVEDVGLYNRALTEGEVQRLYNNGSGWRGSRNCGQ